MQVLCDFYILFLNVYARETLTDMCKDTILKHCL